MTVHFAKGSLANGAPTVTTDSRKTLMRFLLNVLLVAALGAMSLVKAAQQPAAQQPAAQQPAAQPPATQQPVAQEPIAQEPAAQEPVAQQASAQPHTAQLPTTESQVVDRIVNREQEEMRLIRQFSPLVETYVQNFREDKHLGAVPDGDKYLLGRADFSRERAGQVAGRRRRGRRPQRGLRQDRDRPRGLGSRRR